MYRLTIAGLLLHLLGSICWSQSESWLNFVPLETARADVDKVLGKPLQSFDSYALYKTPEGKFSIWFSLGGCGHKIDGRQWNIQRGRMTSLIVYLENTYPLSHFVKETISLKRRESPTGNGRALYIAPDGITIFETISREDGSEFVYSISIEPTENQYVLLCDQKRSLTKDNP